MALMYVTMALSLRFFLFQGFEGLFEGFEFQGLEKVFAFCDECIESLYFVMQKHIVFASMMNKHGHFFECLFGVLVELDRRDKCFELQECERMRRCFSQFLFDFV